MFLLLLEILHLHTLRLYLGASPAYIFPLFNLAHLVPSANAALPPHPHLQLSYLSFSHFVFPPSAILLSLHPLTGSRFFDEMLEVSKSGAQNYHILFHHILLNISVSRNPTSSSSFRIPGFSALRFDRTHFRSGILSSDDPYDSDGVITFVR